MDFDESMKEATKAAYDVTNDAKDEVASIVNEGSDNVKDGTIAIFEDLSVNRETLLLIAASLAIGACGGIIAYYFINNYAAPQSGGE